MGCQTAGIDNRRLHSRERALQKSPGITADGRRDAIAALYTHPQLYVDIGAIDYGWPREEFYGYLRRLINAGFESRIMFGSDQMIWPDAIPIAVQTIRSAPFLTEGQKRDILYNNAARFLRIKQR